MHPLEKGDAVEERMAEEAKINLPAFFGQKAGMTRIFDNEGKSVPVTVIKLVPNYISQVKTTDKEGYTAYQVGFYEKREKLVTKAKKGHLKKAGIDKSFCRFAEVKVGEVNQEFLGKEITLENFEGETYVDVTGTSKGKGFQGVIKRYGFKGGPAAHGSKFHRAPGSIGNSNTPGRVFKQKKMPGQMGNKKRTTQNLKVVEINPAEGYMLVKGSIPGAKNSFVKVTKSVKK